jgi:lipoate-protein ligase A
MCRGHGDLAMPGADGIERKILGASLRQTSKLVFYLGVFLVNDAVALMERYLASPSRQPEYRAGRGHGAFCTNLSLVGVTSPALIAAIMAHGERILGQHAAR